MLGALIATAIYALGFGYNTRRVYMRINDEPAGTVTGWIIGAPLMVVAVVVVAAWWLLVCYSSRMDYKTTMTQLGILGLSVIFVPLVLGAVTRVAVERQERKRRRPIPFNPDW